MIRNIGFLSWKQESSWMESMKGPRWNSMVKRENSIFKDALDKVTSEEDLLQKQNEFKNSIGSMFFTYKNIVIKTINNSEYEWTCDSKTYNVTDLEVSHDYIYHIRDIGEGSQKYRVECIRNNRVIWDYTGIGSQLYIKNKICYVLGVENKLWYNSVIALDSKSGKVLKILYKENDNKYNLRFVKGEGDCLFLIREKSGAANLFIIEELNVSKLGENSIMFYPLGIYRGKICYFENSDNIWRAVGFQCKSFKNMIDFASLKYDLLILRSYGKKIIYNFKFKKIYSFYGNIYFHPLSYKLELSKCFIDFTDGGIVEIRDFNDICYKSYCKLYNHSCISEDGTKVHYLVSYPNCKVKGLIVTGYGAYGISSSVSSRRWKPYLDDGWIVCFTFIRGSGDKDISWALEARTVNKIKSCEDFEACIHDVQKKYHIESSDTCIHGRSAGGYLVGMSVSRNPTGKLFKMVYSEVPYVDVLRTTTNPNLPLTALEYDEFGNPSRSIDEFKKILEFSPVDSLLYNKPPDLSVIVRTSENDSQVYAYESYKWLEALRGVNKNDYRKLLFNSEDNGHFVNEHCSLRSFSEDFFLLNSFRIDASQ